jgi:TetR/AcrR family transcriptional regulator, tetracycline repressor protein
MKVNRERVIREALSLLNKVGLEQLTLRTLAKELGIQAATIYWHFKNKQDLIDEMATVVLAEGSHQLLPKKKDAHWSVWALAFGTGLRKVLLGYREGARLVAGSRLTDTRFMTVAESIAKRLTQAGFTIRKTVVLMSVINDYTESCVMEEQAVYPRPGERSPQYDLAARKAKLEGKGLPILLQSGPILLDRFDRRHREGLNLIIRGAKSSDTRNRSRVEGAAKHKNS